MPITTNVVSSKPVHGEAYSIQDYMISLSVTCDRSVVFSGYPVFLHQSNWPPRYNWNIVESGVKHHKPNLLNTCTQNIQLNVRNNTQSFNYIVCGFNRFILRNLDLDFISNFYILNLLVQRFNCWTIWFTSLNNDGKVV